MSIGDLARRSGFPASTIRYYEKVGLLPAPRRASGRRVYEEQTFDRLLVVTFAKEAGFSLREIRQLFTGFVSGTPAGVRWQKLATAKLAEVEALAARIDTMKELLREALLCGCIDLDACGQFFRQHVGGVVASEPDRKVPARHHTLSGKTRR
jgi:MerR family transcriptional regulator, redox-sensitive transcriptional activator SoxR